MVNNCDNKSFAKSESFYSALSALRAVLVSAFLLVLVLFFRFNLSNDCFPVKSAEMAYHP
jgi:hypothetical protein